MNLNKMKNIRRQTSWKRFVPLMIMVLLLVGLIGGVTLIKAEEKPLPITPKDLPELPDPGILPDSFWYFLDEWGEEIHTFFTFDSEARAMLQTRFTMERVAEINTLLERRGIEAIPYLERAEKRMQGQMARAADILEEQKDRGIEVAYLARKLDNEFDIHQALLEAVFDEEETRLELRIKEQITAIKEARLVGLEEIDFDKIAELRIVIEEVRVQKEKLEEREEVLSAMLDLEEEKIEIKMEIKEKELEILAEKAEGLFDQKEEDLERVFEKKERALDLQEVDLEIQLRQAILRGEDIALAEEIKTKLLDLELEEKALDLEEKILEESLEQEKRGLEKVMKMRERATEQIQDAHEKILDIKEEIREMIEDGYIIEDPIAVLKLIVKAEEKLTIAEQDYAEGNYKKAFSQAMASEMLARNAERILEEYEELDEEAIEENEELEEREISFETIIKDHSRGGYKERRNYVIREEREWILLREKTRQELPDIDFTQYILVAVFSGWKGTGGFSIEITEIIEYPNYIIVYVTATAPGIGDAVTEAPTFPVHIVKFERIDKEVKFEVEYINYFRPPLYPPNVYPPNERENEIVIDPPREEDSEQDPLKILAKCLADDVKFFGTHWCPWCVQQKEMFGEAVKYLPYVECSPDKATKQELSLCYQAGVGGIPDWRFNFQTPDEIQKLGMLSLEKLAEYSGC